MEISSFQERTISIWNRKEKRCCVCFHNGKIKPRFNRSLYFLYNFLETFSGVLRGSGSATAPMLITVGNMCGGCMAALFLFVPLLHTVESVPNYLVYYLALSCYLLFCRKPEQKIRKQKANGSEESCESRVSIQRLFQNILSSQISLNEQKHIEKARCAFRFF